MQMLVKLAPMKHVTLEMQIGIWNAGCHCVATQVGRKALLTFLLLTADGVKRMMQMRAELLHAHCG